MLEPGQGQAARSGEIPANQIDMNHKKADPKCSVWITAGDPNGVGPELVVMALGDGSFDSWPVHLVSSEQVCAQACAMLSGTSEHNRQLAALFQERLGTQILLSPPTRPPAAPVPGAWAQGNSDYIAQALDIAVAGALSTGGAVVTGPVDKRFFYTGGQNDGGHTEYLARMFGVGDPLMLFDAGALKVAVMTRHIPLARVKAQVQFPLLDRSARLLEDYLLRTAPGNADKLIAVAGLDPHCGEWGATSSVDLEVRAWVRRLAADGISLSGPFPADSLFAPRCLGRFSAVLCWYHDQGLIPAKMASFDAAVNVSLGLPVWRTSPAHGVAYDVAWTGTAHPGSFAHAIKLAASLARVKL